ncbi:hypothetical protein B0F89_101267 [Malaciobacter marinus]|jgi:ABC-type Fe3+ transport system permease subunit|uniref:Uncharacterized protein n=1 Tax=Malaciobacter marinus TaxID=505249 RepID=A0AB37A0D7_9BACT|nr:hypothetical protein [Malaciobacter marinus]PPK63066.1 hypothetical protein B0F89_101267 [Malaciobacter marinus]SKB32735.1 hypothetical protein SAMN06295997_105101 [Malaciobacter marinus]
MYESYIAFDVNWRLLALPLSFLCVFYLVIHFINYFVQKSKKHNGFKYLIKEIASATSSVFYTLITALFLLYLGFVSTYVAKVGKEHNITNGADGIKYIIRLGLSNNHDK